MIRIGSRLASLCACQAGARPALRRQVLYRRADHPNLLPVHLSRAGFERGKRLLFPNRGRGRGSGISTLFAVSAGMFTGNARLGGNFEHGVARFAVDR